VLDENTGFSSNVGIRDVWLYQANLLQGVYPVNPVEDSMWATIPVIELEKGNFFLQGGIHETGQSAFHLPYPFWEFLEFDFELKGADTFVVDPLIHYLPEDRYVVPLYEQFESGLVDLIPFNSALSQPDSTFIRTQNTEVFMGNRSGFINFGPDDRFFEAINSIPFQLDRSKDTYLEITYKNSVPFEVGLVYQNLAGLFPAPVVTVNPRGEWNTIYIHLIDLIRTVLNESLNVANFWIWLIADGQGEEGYIYLDNVRVIREK
jgi:hypothetical protein